MKVYVYKRASNSVRDRLPLKTFSTRKDAVYWCKVNQVSHLPDGEWEDDYEIVEFNSNT